MANPAVRYVLGYLNTLVPDFTNLEPIRDRNLNSWREKGAYSVHGVAKTSFTLNVNPREYAEVIFAEAQHLLNHASEHRAHLLYFHDSKSDPSPSWLFVSLYYYSLFIGMAWTRVTNSGILYLDKEAIAQYCGRTNGIPFGGAYKTTLKVSAATGAAQVEMQKCNTSHFHEAVWLTANNEISLATRWVESLSASRKQTYSEELSLRALRLFGGLNFKNALVWPSKLRNAINYRPGFSYRSILQNNFLRIRSRLNQKNFRDFEAVVAFGEKAKANLRGITHPAQAPNEAIDLLIAQSLFLEELIEDALLEICAIKELKSSAFTQRKRFLAQHCQSKNILTKVDLIDDE